MKEKEVIGNGCGRNYADSQSANRKKQDAISRPHGVGFAGEREKLEARIKMTCLLKHTAESHQVQAVKGRQKQILLHTTVYGDNCMTLCMLHKSQKASSNLSHLTNKVT